MRACVLVLSSHFRCVVIVTRVIMSWEAQISYSFAVVLDICLATNMLARETPNLKADAVVA